MFRSVLRVPTYEKSRVEVRVTRYWKPSCIDQTFGVWKLESNQELSFPTKVAEPAEDPVGRNMSSGYGFDKIFGTNVRPPSSEFTRSVLVAKPALCREP